MPRTAVSVIVPVRNEEHLIKGCLKSLLNQTFPADRTEIIVVDNHSSDRTAESVSRFPVKYLFEKTRGAGAARNKGARQANGDLLAFIDADCVAPRNWLSQLVRAMEDGSYDGAGGDYLPRGRNRLINQYLAYRGAYSLKRFFSPDYPSLPWLLTGNFILRKRVLARLGGFEETLFPGEDADLCWRIGLTGGCLKHLPDVFVFHRRPYSLIDFFRKDIRNALSNLKLNLRYSNLLPPNPLETAWQRFRKSKRTLQAMAKENRFRLSQKISLCFIAIVGRSISEFSRFLGWIAFRVLKFSTRARRLPSDFVLNYLLLSSSMDERDMPNERADRLMKRVRNWLPLLEQARRHRLQTRLYSFLRHHGVSSYLPAETTEKIRSLHFGSQLCLADHESALKEILLAFNRAGVEVLLLKGMALLHSVYKERPVRFPQDIDLLVRPQDIRQARILLKDLGYQEPPRSSHYPSPFPSQWHDKAIGLQENRDGLMLFHPDKRILIDLHEDFFDPYSQFQLSSNWFWEGAREVFVDGARGFVPEPNRFFLHLLYHLQKSITGGQNLLFWYLDLDEILRYYRGLIDGRFCARLIETSPNKKKVLEILSFIQCYLSAELPQELVSLLIQEDVKIPSLEPVFSTAGKEGLFSFTHSDTVIRQEHFLTCLGKTQGYGRKLWFLLRWIFPDTLYLEKRYSCGNGLKKIDAYLTHWFALALKGANLAYYLMLKVAGHD